MELERIASEQFGGVQDREVDFAPGLNVVLGDNESGKSTMILALFHGFTTPAKLDKRKSKDFLNRCFPTNGADTIDVELTFKADEGSYKLEKVWDKTGESTQTKLKQPVGGLLRESKAEARLRELLQYGPAIYDYLVFGRQDNEAAILDWCYDFFGTGGDGDLDAARQLASSAVSAVGGISGEQFLETIQEHLKKLTDHWDVERDRPEKGKDLDNPWSKGVGSILSAYYQLRQGQKDYELAQSRTEELTELQERLADLSARKQTLEQRRKELLSQKGRVENRANLKLLLTKEEKTLCSAEQAARSWPLLEQQRNRGAELAKAQTEAARRAEREKVERTLKELQKLDQEIAALEPAVTGREELPADCKTAEKLVKQREKSRGRLLSARLRAEIALEPGVKALVETASGETREITGSADLDLEGYVSLTIPGVGKVRVAPQELDVDALQTAIQDCDDQLKVLLDRWQAPDEESLQALGDQYQEDSSNLKNLRQSRQTRLGGETPESLEARLRELPVDESIQIPDTLAADLAAYLRQAGQRSVDGAVASANTGLTALEQDYTSQENLEAQLVELRTRTADYEKQLSQLGETDLDEAAFQRELTAIEADLEDQETRRTQALQRQGVLTAEDLPDLGEMETELTRLEEALETENRTYRAYDRIRQDVEALQTETEDRLAGFTQRFCQKLSAIGGERLTAENGGGLLLRSGDNALTAGEFLSEGTRKTVLLAFRLAVLESFFPGGGGLVVLDDDLLDMDPGRRQQAAALLHDFAEHNQVIFTTCDPAIADLLGGNRITVS